MRLSEENRKRIVEGMSLRQKELNLTDAELARKMNVSMPRLGEIKRGEKVLERREYLERLVVALELLPKARSSATARAPLADYLASLGEEEFLEVLLKNLPQAGSPTQPVVPDVAAEPRSAGNQLQPGLGLYRCPWPGDVPQKCAAGCKQRFKCHELGGPQGGNR